MSDTPDELAARRIGRARSEHIGIIDLWSRVSALVETINRMAIRMATEPVDESADSAVYAMIVELQEVFPQWSAAVQRFAAADDLGLEMSKIDAELQARADARLRPDPL